MTTIMHSTKTESEFVRASNYIFLGGKTAKLNGRRYKIIKSEEVYNVLRHVPLGEKFKFHDGDRTLNIYLEPIE